MCVKPVGGQRHEEHRVGVEGQRELRGKGTFRVIQNRRFESKVQLGQPTGLFITAIKGVFAQGAQLIQLVIKSAKGHEPIGGHVFGLVGMGRNFGFALLFFSVSRGIVVNLSQDLIQAGLVF